MIITIDKGLETVNFTENIKTATFKINGNINEYEEILTHMLELMGLSNRLDVQLFVIEGYDRQLIGSW